MGREREGNQIGDGLRSSDELWGHPDQSGLCHGVICIYDGALRRGALVELGSRATFWLRGLGGVIAHGSVFNLLECLEKFS